MHRRFKILFATEDFYPENIGGQGIFGFELVNSLRKAGYDVKILTAPSANQLIKAFLEYLQFVFKYRSEYFDILHANQLSGFFFTLFRPKNIGKIVISVHNTNYDLSQVIDSYTKKFLYQPLILLEKLMYKKADGILFHSRIEMGAVRKYYQLNQKLIGLAKLGVNLQKRVKKIPNEEKEKVILIVARLVKRKRVDNVIKALDLLRKENYPVKGVIIGEGPERKNLQNILGREYNEDIEFMGKVDYTSLPQYFLKSDLFVLTSVGEGGLSLTAQEALSYGLPLIVSPEIAEDIVEEGKNGFVVESDNPKKLAEKIKQVLKSRARMSKESLRIATSLGGWDRCAREIASFYQLVLETP